MNILYGVCGEGRGHAGRSFAVAQSLLKRGHNVHVYTSGDGYELFCVSGFKSFNFHPINGLRFGVNNGKISYTKSLANFVEFREAWKRNERHILRVQRNRNIDLVITDFEPILASVARKMNVPLITLDNQHKFLSGLGSGFDSQLRLYNTMTGWFVRTFIGKADAHLVTTFHDFPAKDKLHRVNIIVREEYEKLKPFDGGYVVVYLRQEIYDTLLPALRASNVPLVVYGAKGRVEDKIRYMKTSYLEFARNLAGATAVICGAGNQLIGEAKYLGKKIMAIPIPNQKEQDINGRYVELDGLGICRSVEEVDKETIVNFLTSDFAKQKSMNGLHEVIGFIEGNYGKTN